MRPKLSWAELNRKVSSARSREADHRFDFVLCNCNSDKLRIDFDFGFVMFLYRGYQGTGTPGMHHCHAHYAGLTQITGIQPIISSIMKPSHTEYGMHTIHSHINGYSLS